MGLRPGDKHVSTFSGPVGNCVQVRRLGGSLIVSHSKDLDGKPIHFTESEWQAFIEGVKAGEFDLD